MDLLNQPYRTRSRADEPNHIKELRKRGYNWANLFSRKWVASSFEQALHNEQVRQMNECHMVGRADETLIPWEALEYTRTLPSDSVTGGSALGGYLVENQVPPIVPIPALLPVSAILRSGCEVITTPHNNLLMPRLAMPIVGTNSGETTVSSLTQGFVTTQVSLNSQWFSASITVSNQILAQAAAGSEETVKWIVDLMRLAIGNSIIDFQAINGGGSNAQQILGLINWPVGSGTTPDSSKLAPSITFGGAPTWSSVQSAHKNLDTWNYPRNGNNRTILLDATSANVFATTPLVSTFPSYLLDNNKCGECDVIVTNQLANTKQMVMIDGSECVVLLAGGGFSVLVDRYTYMLSNQTLITVGVACDFSLKRGHAVLSTDAANQ